MGTGTDVGESIIQDVKGISVVIQRSLRDLLHQIPSTEIAIKVLNFVTTRDIGGPEKGLFLLLVIFGCWVLFSCIKVSLLFDDMFYLFCRLKNSRQLCLTENTR